MRKYIYRVPLGSTMIGSQVAKVIESKNPKFPVGKYVVAHVGWRTHTVLNEESDKKYYYSYELVPYVLPNFDGLSVSLGLGALGMPG